MSHAIMPDEINPLDQAHYAADLACAWSLMAERLALRQSRERPPYRPSNVAAQRACVDHLITQWRDIAETLRELVAQGFDVKGQ